MFYVPVAALQSQGGGRLGQAYLSLPLGVRGDVQRDVKEQLVDFTLDAPITMTLEAYLASAAAMNRSGSGKSAA